MSNTSPSRDTQAPKPAGIDWLSTTAGALAAVTSALLLSTLGAVGTLIGAAIGSVAATVGSNLYSQWLAKTHQKVTSAQVLARWRSAGLAGVRHEAASEPAGESGDGTTAIEATELADAEPAPSWRERLEALPWKRIALLSLAMFVVVVAVITVFELLAGRSVSSIVGNGDGGTTISRVTGGGSDARDEGPGTDPSNGATATPEESPSTTTEPSEEEPQESESPATGTPSAEPSTSTGPSAPPSEQPSESAGTSSEPSPTTGASSEATEPATP
ncbi:hypothetical protein [Nocardioides luteus]|uniref:hypothetical protein n=1 Tax=Nocardioides luteus TaxID=1844 RepID=UPI0018C9AE1A|nr:hypothetical protein [Nocardioides luteus]MBG6099575.1 hypothetical protein [Nocardioides luteus]